MELAIQVGALVVFLISSYGIGSWIEARHYKKIQQNEDAFADLIVTNLTTLPNHQIEDSMLVLGNVVISLDYFKRFIASLRMLFGGRLVAYEPLLDRARREAILRMKEQARINGCDLIINFRMETSRLANDNQQRNNSTAGVEILVYGTAIKLAQLNDPIHP